MRANYRVEIASGIFLLLGIAALVWLATRATDFGQDIGDQTYIVSARFDNVGDLRGRAPVKIGGVTVGLVESIALDPVTFEALVNMEIDSRYNEIPNDTGASVLTSGILGDRYIGLEPGGSPEMLQEGDELFITQSAIVLEQLIGKFLFGGGGEEE
ncbi:MAG TPA: outer membrane lipid asymmetry maintenance protein MlaD [Xanthomonadales bacterium]|nr:outer membrane lipid asymmetry maintenance protein MlaD [Xanthomonadales bacterium]